MSWPGTSLADSDPAINQVTVVYQVWADFGFLCFSDLGHYSFAFFFFFSMFLKSLRKKQAIPLKYLLRVHILNERYLPCLFKRHLKALRLQFILCFQYPLRLQVTHLQFHGG